MSELGTLSKYKRGFRDLVAWQEAHKLTVKLYKATESFPNKETFGITGQMRRAASSVGANLAEGASRKTHSDRNHFYTMAKSSLAELDNFMELSHDLGYLKDAAYKELLDHLNRVAYLIFRLIEHKDTLP